MTLPPKTPSVYQMKISLLYSEPLIWRRVLVPNSLTLSQLHIVLQYAMGWGDEHLHQFEIGDYRFGEPNIGLFSKRLDEEDVVLGSVVSAKGERFTYEYDFGDAWVHELVVEEVLPVDAVEVPLACLGGEMAGPPEDSGGVMRYAYKLQILENPEDPEHKELLEWFGEDFDPRAFSAERLNARLAALWSRWKTEDASQDQNQDG